MKKLLSVLALLSAVLVVNNISAKMGGDCASQNAWPCSKGRNNLCIPNKRSSWSQDLLQKLQNDGVPNLARVNDIGHTCCDNGSEGYSFCETNNRCLGPRDGYCPIYVAN